MTKVGILSMQRIANYGSFLQAFGLKHILEDLGYEVQFVDYRPGECLIPSHEGSGMKRKISKALETMKYKATMQGKIRYITYKKNYAKNYFPYLGITDEKNYNPDIDALVIGSDEVFNCIQDNPNVGFTPELFGANSRADIIISYAASFGNTTFNKLQEYNIDDQVGEWLKRFDAISVRDENSRSIVQMLTGDNPPIHLDPALIYDFTSCEAIPKEAPNENYMILYGYSGRFSKEECKAIRLYANEKELKIYCIGGLQECCDKFIDCNPFEVIGYFHNAESVITDTFHGTILSIITHRPFISFIRSKGYGNSEKIDDLLNRLGLKSREIAKMDSEIYSVMSMPIVYEEVDAKIKEERIQTYNYLRSCIG